MTRYWTMLLALGATWGASYLFIKVAVRDLEPAPMMTARMLIAALLLFAYLFKARGVRRSVDDVRQAWRPALVLGAINAAIPFTLVAWGEKYIDSGIAAIAQASVPIFVVLLALRFSPSDRANRSKALGLALGLAGVGVVTGLHPQGGWWGVAGTLAVVLASLSYASGNLYAQKRVQSVAGPVLAAGSMLFGFLLLLPLGLLQAPDHLPGWKPALSLLALAVVGTAAAQLVLFRMIRLHGSSRVSLVAYLMPFFALVYGALLLDERFGAAAIVGLVLILAGVALGSGAIRVPRREAVVQQP